MLVAATSEYKYITVVDKPWPPLGIFIRPPSSVPHSMPHYLSGDDIVNLRLRSIPPYVTREYFPPSR
jgi:hypothetical protein